MSIFGKRSTTETHIMSIEHRFDTNEIAFKYPYENISSGSILFVNPGQQAILICEGRIAEVFSEGRYQLTTDNFPILSNVINTPFNGAQSFRCRVVFINNDREVQVYWGTKAPINVRDPLTLMDVRVRGNGSFTMKIDNSSVFFVKTLGDLSDLTVESLEDYIFDKTVEKITSKISGAISLKKIPIVEIASHYSELSEEIYEQIVNEGIFEKYGLRMSLLSISDINVNEEDWKQLQDYQNEFLKEKRKIDLLRYKGDLYDKEIAHDVLKTAAANEGAGGVMNVGMGLGMGLGVGGGFGAAMGQMAQSINPNQQGQKQCPACNRFIPYNSEFCSHCGANTKTNNICPNCGNIINVNSSFCGSCGSQIKKELDKIECPNCHNLNDIKMKFCGTCGTKLVQCKVCPSCGKENDLNSLFCGNCGTKI